LGYYAEESSDDTLSRFEFDTIPEPDGRTDRTTISS